MKTIDLENWPRKDHYLFFKEYDYPYFSLCADMDITLALDEVKRAGISFTAFMMYLVARCANGIPEFRHRVREGGPVEFDVVHPSATILTENDLFTFCTVPYQEDFAEFIREAEEEIALVKTTPSLEEKFPDDRMLFMSSIPWVSFSAFMHPLKLKDADSIPRFAWGKYRSQGDQTVIPLSVQGHHAVMDGLHAGRFYSCFQELLNHPALYFGG